MIKDIWLNLPVADVSKAAAFYKSLGFMENPGPGNTAQSVSFLVGEKKCVLMLFHESVFASFINGTITNTPQTNEVLFSIGMESKAGVDELAAKVTAAGGQLYSPVQTVQGWMYGFGFADLDGHKWNPLFMDVSKLPQ